MFARRSLQISFTVVCVIVYLIALFGPANAAVTLVSFAAKAGIDEVLLDWETATELDNAGFYIRRSNSQSGPFSRVSPFIPSEGDPLIEANYLWVDDTVVNGTTYWYQLESVDLSQNSEFYGPVSAIPGTVNPTGSPTATRTVTPTGPTSAATATSPVPPVTTTPVTQATSTSSSAYPAPATVTAIPTVVQFPTAVQLPTTIVLPGTAAPLPSVELPAAPVSGTITLVPFPELTLTFPEGGIIIPGTPTETGTPTAVAAGDLSGNSWSPLGGILLVVILVLIWGLLGTSFYLSFRRVS